MRLCVVRRPLTDKQHLSRLLHLGRGGWVGPSAQEECRQSQQRCRRQNEERHSAPTNRQVAHRRASQNVNEISNRRRPAEKYLVTYRFAMEATSDCSLCRERG